MSVKHGLSRTTEYKIWSRMKERCYSPSDKNYPYYGGRGITVCEEWRESFLAFYAAVGARPSKVHTLDRKNNERGYEPGNVQWSEWSVQMRNRRGWAGHRRPNGWRLKEVA